MERLTMKCTPKVRMGFGCIVEGKCKYTTVNRYCGYCGSADEFFALVDKLGQMEDEAEQQEQGCDFCNGNGEYYMALYTLTFKNNDCKPMLMDRKNNIEWDLSYIFMYCPVCGRKLVEHR